MLVGLLLGVYAAPVPTSPVRETADEIVVTGERVHRSLRETPSSVAVFEKRDLEKMAAPDRIQDLLSTIPNVLVPMSRDPPVIRGQSGVGVLQGLPAFLGGARPRTVMQIDGRTVTFNEFVNSTEGLWDVDHVEVFRSPQTTTQGVNSIAGAIFIHTAEPGYKAEGRAQVIAGTWGRRQASAALSMPIVADQVALRVSGDFYRSHTSTTMAGPLVGVNDLNLDHSWTGRAKLLAEPRGIPGLKVLTTYVHTHSQAPQVELARPPFRARQDDDYEFGYFKSDVNSLTTVITYPLARTAESRTTMSWGQSHFRRLAPRGFGQTQIHAHDASIETVVEWKPSRAVSAVGGISVQEAQLNQLIDLSITPLGTGSFRDRQRSAGVFGDVTWHPADRWTLTAGARYQSDGKRRTGQLESFRPLPMDYDKTSSAFLPKVSAAFDFTAHARAGLMVQRAYNPGGVTLDPAHHAQLDFKPEYLWDYEAFVRSDLFNGRAIFNGNLFYDAMRNSQRELDFDLNSPGGRVGLLQIISEPRARTYGAEFDLTAKASSRLSIQLSAGFLNTRITKGIAPNDPFFHKEFAMAPHFTGMVGVEWRPLRDLALSAQARHSSSYWADDDNEPLFRTTGWTTVDARLTWQARHVMLFGYARNVFDTLRPLSYSGPQNDPAAEVELTNPREVGIGIEARF